MSVRSDEYLKNVPMKSYDLVKEGLIVLGIVGAIIVVLAVIFGSPDYPTVTIRAAAINEPLTYLETSANFLAGRSDLDGYGPPYTKDYENAQKILGIAPANVTGVTIPINPAKDFVLTPLSRLALFDKNVANALEMYKGATASQQQAWNAAYLGALAKAKVVNGDQVQIPKGDYGPVGTMMNGMLILGQTGFLTGILESGKISPYALNYTKPLLFEQGDILTNVASSLDMLGSQWGISHETGLYPGAWWVWPYVFLYQIPPMSTSPNGDLEVGVTMAVLFLILLFLPFIPVLNKIPKWIGVHRIIWRDWYRRTQNR